MNPHLHLHTKQPTWDQGRTLSMFSMMPIRAVRDVGKRGTLLGIAIGNIDLMGGNTCQYLRGWTPWWNKHLLSIGTTTNKAIQDFKQKIESPQHSCLVLGLGMGRGKTTVFVPRATGGRGRVLEIQNPCIPLPLGRYGGGYTRVFKFPGVPRLWHAPWPIDTLTPETLGVQQKK